MWIEIAIQTLWKEFRTVTPLAGVWIEISVLPALRPGCLVTPLAGVWIEIIVNSVLAHFYIVTPLAGVWIEMPYHHLNSKNPQSLPLRECGLKLILRVQMHQMQYCHSPCGSVD